MCEKTNPPWLPRLQRYVVIAGCFLIKMPIGIDWYYGNLSTYTNSYFLFVIGPSAFDFNPDWLLPANLAFYALGIFSVDVLSRKFTMATIQLSAILTYLLGMFLSYFAVQHSVAFLFITLAMCSSFAAGISAMVCLKDGYDVMSGRVGLVTAILSFAISAGSVVNNFAITAFVNPGDLSPNTYRMGKVYFSQTIVIDYVPKLFLVLGVSASVLQCLGYALQQCPFLSWGNGSKSRSKQPASEEIPVSNANEEEDPKGRSPHQDAKAMDISSTSIPILEQEQTCLNLKPSQVIRRKSFYLLLVGRFVLTYCAMLYLNSYKSLGQLWIGDDTFLASIGSLGSASNGLFRILGGLFVDRFGVKKSFMLGMSLNTIFLSLWYFSPRLDRWLYFICCQALTGVHGHIFIIFPTASLKMYGPKHYAANYGLVMLSSVTSGVICPIIFYLLQSHFRWYSLVCFGCFVSTSALFFSVFALPS